MKHINCLLLFLMASLVACCQSAGLQGRILNDENEPVIAATITIQSTGKKTITNKNGEFSIPYTIINTRDSRLITHDSLLITSIGYEQKKIGIAEFPTLHSPLTIILTRKTTTLSGITISTGYQELPKERATGSFDQLNNKLLNQQVSSGIIERLEAVANSVSMDRITGTSPRLQVRGLSTIIGLRDPLIVLDNFPYEGDINNINPNDIESISILKDAAATSIWGARAGNGVIVITSKKTKANQPLTIEWNNNIKVTAAPDLFYRKQMAPADYIEVEQMLFNNNNRLSDTSNVNHPAFSPAYEILLKQRNGQLTAQLAAAALDQLRNHDMRNDFNKYMYKPSLTQQHYLSLQVGSQQLAWNFSLGYDKTNNELSAINDRISLRIGNQFRPSKRWLVATTVAFTKAVSTSGKTSFDQLATVPVYSSIVDDNGNRLPVMKNYRQPWLDTIGRGRLLDWSYYPLTDYKYNTTKTTNNDLLLGTSIKYQLLSWLSADIKYQYEKQETETSTVYDQLGYYTRNQINYFTRLGKAGAPDTFRIPKGGISDDDMAQLQSHSFRPQLTINKTVGFHSINAIAGFELRSTATNSRSSRLYGFDPETLSSTQVDYATSFPTFVTGATSFIPSIGSVYHGDNRFVSFFGNAAYTYKDRYTVSFSGRRDASNLFGVNTNDKWQPLWSSGLLWDISKESFYKSKLLPVLRLRATYGISGNIDPARAAVTTISYFTTNPFTQTPSAIIERYGNPDLQWEKVNMLNTGIDFASANNRFTGSIEYYYKDAKGLFGAAPVDNTAGVGISVIKNVASMKANGMDIELNAVIINKPLRWAMQLNYSFYKDRITQYYLSSLRGSNFIRSGYPVVSGLENHPVYSVFSYQWAGLDATGDPVGYVNGQPSKDYNTIVGATTLISDLKFNGSALPVHFGSFGNTFSWKHIELSFRFMYKLGYYFRRSSIDYGGLFGQNLVGHSDYSLRWQKPGDEQYTNVPAMVYPNVTNRYVFYSGSETLIEKGDHIRLRYISLAWTLTRQQWIKLPLRSLQLYFTVDNVGIIWRANKQGIDPDAPIALIPPSRSVAAGIRVNF